MNKLLPLLLVLAAPLTTPLIAQGGRTAYSPIVFNGIIVQDGKTKVSLYNPATNDAKWVQVGKKFGNFTVGFEPGRPATERTPATKDTVILTVGNSRQVVGLQDAATLSTNNPVPTAAPARTAANGSAAQVEALALRLAEVRNNPNADPATVQAYEQAIARQTQQLTTGNAATLNFTNNANGAAATTVTTRSRVTTNADGTRTITTEASGNFSSDRAQPATRPAPQPAQ